MAEPKRVTQADRDQIRQLHAAGKGRNAICRELDLSAGTVTAAAKAMNLSFDRTATMEATAARKADLAERRANLELGLLDDAEKLRAEIWRPREYRQPVGGQEPRVMAWELTQPTAFDQQKLMHSAGIAIDKSIRLGQVNSETGVEDARSMLGDLLESMTEAVRGSDA